MATLAFAVPVLPGKLEDWKRVCAQLNGERRAEYEALSRAQGTSVQRIYLQQSPQGDLVIAYLEGEDVMAGLRALAESQEPFARWLRGELQAIHGVDFGQAPPGPISELYVELRTD